MWYNGMYTVQERRTMSAEYVHWQPILTRILTPAHRKSTGRQWGALAGNGVQWLDTVQQRCTVSAEDVHRQGANSVQTHISRVGRESSGNMEDGAAGSIII